MNLFVTDLSPEKSAMALDDKLLMEANQMLSLAIKARAPEWTNRGAPSWR